MPVPASRLIVPVTSINRRPAGTVALSIAATGSDVESCVFFFGPRLKAGGQRRARIGQPLLDRAQETIDVAGDRIGQAIAFMRQMQELGAQIIELECEQPAAFAFGVSRLRGGGAHAASRICARHASRRPLSMSSCE